MAATTTNTTRNTTATTASTATPQTSTVDTTVQTPTSTTTTTNGTTPAPSSTTIAPVIECPSSPCPLDSSCLNGTCQCLPGRFLQNGRCIQAQVFPGQLHLTSLTFQSDMSNRASQIFRDTAANISRELREILRNQPGYVRSDIVQLAPGSVQATVNNIFEASDASQDSVNQAINDAIKSSNITGGLLTDATFDVTDLCEQQPPPCDPKSTRCSQQHGRPMCFCNEGFITTLYSNMSCTACPSGSRAERNLCQPCSFGYNGFNCNDSALLAVVVISCVLGGVLLILVLALLIYATCKRCSKRKPVFDSSPYPVDAGTWPVQDVPSIPRATTNWDTNPSIEMTEGRSHHGLMDKKSQTNGLTGSYDLNPESMKTFKGKNPSRYSYLVQGHENPYFLPGEDKKVLT